MTRAVQPVPRVRSKAPVMNRSIGDPVNVRSAAALPLPAAEI